MISVSVIPKLEHHVIRLTEENVVGSNPKILTLTCRHNTARLCAENQNARLVQPMGNHFPNTIVPAV